MPWRTTWRAPAAAAPRRPGLGGGQGQRLRPRHRARLRRPARRRRLCAARPGRGRSALRALGWRGPILLLEGCFEPRDLELCSRLDLWHMVHHEAQIDMLAAHKTHAPHRVFLKMNSGMNRLGFAPAAFRTRLGAAERAAAGRRDLADDALRRCRRRARHGRAGGGVRGRHARPARRALAEQQRGDAAPCRGAGGGAPTGCAPASCCYGSAPDYPAHDIAALGAAAGDDAARAAHRAAAAAGAATASATAAASRADAPMRIGVVACGYADGYPRRAATGTPVLVDGVRTRTVGRVSMDMITVDLTPVPAGRPGSEVTLWGRGPRRQRAAHRRGGASRRHDGLRADVRAGAAGAGARGRADRTPPSRSHRPRRGRHGASSARMRSSAWLERRTAPTLRSCRGDARELGCDPLSHPAGHRRLRCVRRLSPRSSALRLVTSSRQGARLDHAYGAARGAAAVRACGTKLRAASPRREPGA